MSFRVDLIRAIAISLWFAALAHAQTIPQDSQPDVLIGAEWDSGLVRLFSGSDGALLGAGVPFGPDFHGGVRVATGDLTGDGVADLVTAQAMGGSRIRIVDGITAATLIDFEPFGPDYHGGLFVATGDLTGDGRADLLVGQGMGGLVKAYNSATMTELGAGAPFGPAYSGGVTVAAGDVNGDGQVDVIAGMAMGGLVRVFHGMSATELMSGFPYGPLFMGGVNVAAGDMSGDGRAEIVVAPRGGSDAIIIVNPATLAVTPFRPEVGPYGINIAVGDVDLDGRADLLTAALEIARPLVRIFSGATGAELLSGQPFPENFRGGVTIATTASASGVAFTSPDTATFPVGAVGTFTITTSGRPYPITQTGALPTGVTFTDHGDGTATLAGTPAVGTGAAYALVFRGGPGGTVTQAFTLLVTEPPTFTSTGTAATFVVGTAGSFTFTTAGYPPPTFTVSGALPAGVTFTDLGDGTATLAGTPAAGTGGTYPLTVTALNGIGPDADAATATLSFTLTVTQAPTFTSAASTTFAAGTAGTFTITTAGVPTVTSLVRSGAALPSGVTFTDNGDGTATLAGTPAAGTGAAYVLIFTADNGVGTSATQNFTLTVNEAPAITSAATVTFPIGAPGSFTVTTTGFPRPTIARAASALPAGVTFVDNGDGTGTLSGTPAAGSGGTYAFTLTAANGIGTEAVQVFTLTVNSAPAFTSAPATTFTVGSAGTFSITTTGTPAVTTIAQAGALPAGVTFTDNGNGSATLAGTPAAGTGGTHALTFTASNGVDVPAVQSFVLTVTEAPAFTSAATMTFPLGAVTTFTVTTAGFPVPALTLGGAALPSGVTFVDNGDGTATLSGTPAAGTGGNYAITFTAANGIGTNAVQNAALTVDQSPGFTSAASATFTVGTAGTFSVTTTGSPAVTAIALGGVTLPTGVTFTDNADGTATLAGTPAAATGGTYAITFTATNGVHTPVVQNFVLSVNQPPAIASAAATTFVTGNAGTFTVTTTGFPAPAITIGGAALPSGVTWVDNGDGTGALAGTPAAGTGGAYALTFTAANGIGTNAVQSFTLTVSQGPAITSATTTTFTVGAAGTFTVTTSGSPTPALTLTGTLPSGVTFVDNGDGTGTLSGTPAAGTGGAHALTFTASNGIGSNGTQAFTLNVNAAPVVTSAAAATFTIGTAGSFTVTTTGFPAPAIAIGGVALPGGLTFVDNGNGTGTLAGTPAAGTGGSYAISFTATNAVGASAPQAFTLTVNGPPSITSANTTTFTVGAPGTFTVTAIGSPTPALAVSGSLPSGVTFLDNGNGTGTLSGTPAAGTGGSYALTFTASNGVLPNGTQTFTLNINQAPVITSAASAAFAVGTLGSFTVTTSGFPPPAIAIGGVALPAGLAFVNNGNGTATLAGMPAAGTGGTYAVSFTATNAAGASAQQAFTLTVNQAPAITSATSVSFVVGAAGTFTVTTTGFPTAAITRTGVALPGGVTFVDNGNGTGTLSGTPATGTAGAYAFTFTAANGLPPNAVQAFTLNVNQPPAITSAASATFTVGTPGTFTVTTTGFPTPTVSQTGTLPTGATFTPATRVLGGTATQTGAFPLVFTATNAIPPDATQNFTLNVVCPAITVNPVTLPDGLFQTAYGPVTFTQTGSTGSTFTWGATGLPAGLAISTAGVVSGTPTNTVLNGAVSVTVTDNFGCTGTRNTTITVRPTTDPETLNGGVGNTQFVFGAAVPATPHVFVNDNVKTGDAGPGTLTVMFPATSSNGIVTEGTTDGTFIYTPNVGFAGPTDVFTYTLTDGNGVTNTGTVTINLSNVVWYVNSAGANGDGRSHNPFNALNNAAAPSLTGQSIYVHTGGAATPGDLALDANQALHGAGAAFALNSLTIAAGTRPTLSGTVTLNNNTAVTAVNFSGAATALSATGLAATLPIAIDQVNVTGGTTGLALTNVTATGTGAVTISNSTFTNTGGAEISMSGGNIPVTVAATTTISSNAGGSITIQNRTGGTVSFASPVSVTAGTGVSLTTNTGSTIAFTGGLALSTGANPAFTATGGGTVTATQNNTTIVNTITTTTGTALNVANTTIGASGLTFRSVSVNGAPQGILLNTTGALGGLTVTGNGGTCTPAAPTCSGGRIQNTTGADDSTATPVGTGIALNNTAAVSLTRMRLDNHSNYAIRGTSVNGFTFDTGLVDGANGTNVNTPFNDGSFVFFGVTGSSSGMTGTSSITNSTIQGGHQRNIAIDNSVGTLNLTVSGNTIRRTSDAAGDDGFFLEADTTANVTLGITNNTFARHGGDHINVTMVNNAVVAVTITGNMLHGNYAGTPEGNHPIGLSQGIFLFGASFNGTLTYNVSNNGTVAVPFRGSRQGGAIHVNKGSGTATVSGTIANNVIGDPAVIGSGSSEAFGIIVGSRGAGGSHTTLINNNQIRQYFDRGIVLEAGEGTAALNATVTNNTVSNFADAVNSLHGIHSDNGILAGDTNAVCLNISGNTVGTAGNEPQGGADLRLRRGASTTVAIPGIGGTDNAAAIARLQALNPTATTVTVTGGVFSNVASCPVP